MFNLKINGKDIEFKISIKTLKDLITWGDRNALEVQNAPVKGINALLYQVNLGEPIALIETMKILSAYKITEEDIEDEIDSNSNLLVEFKEKFEEEIKKSGFIKTPLITQKTLLKRRKLA